MQLGNHNKITPCPEERSVYIVYEKRKTIICNCNYALSFVPTHLGNTLLAISNILYIAEKTASKVVFPSNSNSLDVLLIDNSNILYDFRNDTTSLCSRFYFVDYFFNTSSTFLGVNLSSNTILDKSRALKAYLKPHIRIKIIPMQRGTLVIHIRSGDIMLGEGSHPGYAQPPLAFYQKIISSENFSQIIVVTEDHNNPTADALAKWNNQVTFSTGLIHDDVAAILGASHLVLSYGTFSWMLSLISDTLSQLYVPCMPYCSLTWNCDDIPVAAACYTFPGFTKNGEWHNTRTQRQHMLSYNISDVVVKRNKYMTI